MHRQLRDSMQFVNPVSQNFDILAVFKQINHNFVRELQLCITSLTMCKHTIIEVMYLEQWNISAMELNRVSNIERKCVTPLTRRKQAEMTRCEVPCPLFFKCWGSHCTDFRAGIRTAGMKWTPGRWC